MQPISRRDLIKRLKEFGFNGPFSGSKHPYMVKGTLKLTIPNKHKEKEIWPELLEKILNQAKISRDEWENSKK